MQSVGQFSVVEYIWTTMLVYRPNQITLDETVLCEKVYGLRRLTATSRGCDTRTRLQAQERLLLYWT